MFYLYYNNSYIINNYNNTLYNKINYIYDFYFCLFILFVILILCNIKNMFNYWFSDYNIINDTSTPILIYNTNNNYSSKCSICLDNNNNNSIQLLCSHEFHKKCIHTWIKQIKLNNTSEYNCPICRTIII